MPPGFVVVTFPRRRGVFMDNLPMGKTGDLLTVQVGMHDFDMGSPADYTPVSQTVNVVNTLPTNPIVVAFSPLMTGISEGAFPATPSPADRGVPSSKPAGRARAKVPTKTTRKAKAPKRKVSKKKVAKKKVAKRKVAKKKR